jgi:hypothetical protein
LATQYHPPFVGPRAHYEKCLSFFDFTSIGGKGEYKSMDKYGSMQLEKGILET